MTPPHPIHRTKNLIVHIVPLFTDNYSYILQHTSTKKIASIDPAEAQKVMRVVKGEGFEVEKVLTTHKHWDHAGGNNDMKKLNPGIDILGSSTNVDSVNCPLKHGDTFKICDGNTEVQVFHSPCHTDEHLLFYLPEEDVIFVGDTFFVGGCGRFFEGNASQMWNNVQMMRKLPPSTKIFCGHEYTLKNLAFARSVDPDNEALKKKSKWAQSQRSKSLPTIPSTLEEEFAYNPFFRADQDTLQKACNTTEAVETMRVLREKKDHF